MENVEALADDKKPNLQHLETSFHDLNYAIAYCVLQTHEFGLPQDRKRAITHTHIKQHNLCRHDASVWTTKQAKQAK